MRKRSKKRQGNRVLIIFVLLLILGFSGYYLYNKYYSLEVTFIDDLKLDVNSEVEVKSLIKESSCDLSESFMVDTSKLGNNFTNLKFLCNGKEKNHILKYEVVDREAPVISSEKEVSVYVNKEIDLVSLAKVSDNSKEDIQVTVKGEYDLSKVGKYNLSYEANDSSGNIGTFDFVLSVVIDKNNMTFTTSKGFIGKTTNGITYIDGILIVNKSYSIPSSYGNGLTSETKNAFNEMNVDAKKEGLNLYISSGYRSYYSQQSIYNNYVSYDGQKNADTYSARAGHSEHQTGLAFDLNTIDDSFTNTPEGKWVHDNCYKYGLILRYPKGKDNITGYMHESWHLRYVGKELASKLYNDGDWITLEEYYGIDSKYS